MGSVSWGHSILTEDVSFSSGGEPRVRKMFRGKGTVPSAESFLCPALRASALCAGFVQNIKHRHQGTELGTHKGIRWGAGRERLILSLLCE